MSYYQGGNYQQPPSGRYQEQYAQYPQGQNGGYPNQQAPLPPPPPIQPQYPGQATYGQQQYGGPVQQSQGGYQNNNMTSPRATSFASAHASQHQSPQTYNPQNYAQSPQQSQGQIPQYNPQSYASLNSAPYPAQYNSAAYPEPVAQATSGPLSDVYAYSPSSAGFPSPNQPSFRRSPQHSQYGSQQQQQYSPQPPQHQYGYQSRPSPSPPQPSYSFQDTAPNPQPSYTEMPYPSNDWQQRQQSPQRHASSAQASQRRYGNISPAADLTDGHYSPAPPYQSNNHQASSLNRAHTTHGPSPSPPVSTPGPTPPAHGSASRSNTLGIGRHPSQRPLPGLPEPQDEPDYFQPHGRRMNHEEAEDLDQDELFSQVEDAVLNAGRPGRSPSIALTSPPYEHRSRQSFGTLSPRDIGMVNGSLSPGPQQSNSAERYGDDSDPEAAAGLEAMRLAEEQEAANDFRRPSVSSTQRPFTGYNSQRIPRHSSERSTDSRQNGTRISEIVDDYTGVDVSMFGGGYDVQMSYGGDPSQLAVGGDVNGDGNGPAGSSQHSSMRRSHRSQNSSYDYNMDSIHPFPPFRDARVDEGGTGGNYEPPADGRRQSYDEGDEYTLMEDRMPERFPDEPPDVFFNSTTSTHRPLPPPPPGENGTPLPQGGYPYAPNNGYDMNAQGQWVPRSASLIDYKKTPQVNQPLRSKTDAEERRLRQTRPSSGYNTYDTTPATSAVAIDLPSLPTRRFVPSKLGTPDFKKCDEPWALSSILSWVISVTNPDQTTELKEAAIKEALVNLFTNKVPTMNIADAEGLSDRVVDNMYQAGALITTEEWVKLIHVPMSGVIFQLSKAGCYSPTLHDHVVPGRCYAHHCQRTLKKVNLLTQPVRTSETWAEFYGLKKEDIEGKEHKEIERQNVLHEIVQTEDFYMEQLNLLRIIYRDPLANSEPSIVTPKRKDKFLKDVFGKLEQVKQANEDHLLPQLKYRQHEQGPWIVGFSDIFRQWIRMAKVAYIDYAGSFPGASFMVRQEMERNIQFAGFLDKARNDPRGKRLGWDTYLKAPITRLQRYTLLLHTVLRNMKTDSEEKTNLKIAYDEVKAVTLECDTRVAEMQRKVDLTDLSAKLVLRPGMQSAVELNLNHLGRELVHRGDLQRMGGNRFTWLDSHTLLFDHYLVIAKSIHHRAEQGGRVEKYDVSRLPIPMDLLVLESTTDPAVQKSSYVKGITTVSAVTGRSAASSDATTLGRTQSSSPGPGLATANTGMSASTLHTVTSIDTGKDSDKILYPIRIKHLGRENYNLFAHTEQARREWCTKIIEAKTKHAKALHAQHAEPFRLRVVADSAFVYDGFASAGGKTLVIKGTPIDRAIEEVEQRFKDTGRPGPICRARVNCATSFALPYPGKQMVAVGTDFGVFVSEADNPRGWTKAISMTRVTQIAVLEEFNLFLLISDKSLIAYHLDVVTAGPASTVDSSRKAPQKLSGSRDVGFFVAGRMKDRTLVFYKKRDNLSSTFKVLEPIYQKSSERKRAGFFKRGSTEFFREFDDFYIPTECTGINLFTSSLAVSTARGFEVLSLERKVPQSVPEVQGESVQNIVRHIKDQRALGMLRLSEAEFLLCYANCAVYVNKHGEISRSVIMEFVGTAQSAALSGAYLVLFDTDFIEIRNAQNGRLKQIIAGREIKCLDDGGEYNAGLNRPPVATGNGSAYGSSAAGGRTVKAVMQHPENEKTQIVVELLLNEEMKDG